MDRRIIFVVFLLIISFSLYSCGGRTALPVAEYQLGDQGLSCETLKYEINATKLQIAQKSKKVQGATGQNVVLGAAGALLFWPALFWMDLSGAEKIESEALRKRHNVLVQLANKKGCNLQ